MKFSVDKIEDDIVVLEDIESNKIRKVSINAFDFKVKEKDIVIFAADKYFLDNDEKGKRIKRIKEKMEKLIK